MNARDRRAFELWAESEEHQARVAQSRREVAACPDGSTVLFSGGKDSLVVLHLAVEAGKCAQAVHRDHGRGLMPAPFLDEIREQMRTVCGTRALPVIIDDDHPDIPLPIPFIIGSFRADENGRRRRGGPDAKAFGLPCRHVIFDWSWLDVWAYIVTHKLPYHSAYDARAAVEGWDKVRFSAFFADDLAALTGAVDGLTAWRYRGQEVKHGREQRREHRQPSQVGELGRDQEINRLGPGQPGPSGMGSDDPHPRRVRTVRRADPESERPAYRGG